MSRVNNILFLGFPVDEVSDYLKVFRTGHRILNLGTHDARVISADAFTFRINSSTKAIRIRTYAKCYFHKTRGRVEPVSEFVGKVIELNSLTDHVLVISFKYYRKMLRNNALSLVEEIPEKTTTFLLDLE